MSPMCIHARDTEALFHVQTVCVCVCVCVCMSVLRMFFKFMCVICLHYREITHINLKNIRTTDIHTQTHTHQLLSGTYPSDLKKPETEMRSLMRLNGDKLTLE